MTLDLQVATLLRTPPGTSRAPRVHNRPGKSDSFNSMMSRTSLMGWVPSARASLADPSQVNAGWGHTSDSSGGPVSHDALAAHLSSTFAFHPGDSGGEGDASISGSAGQLFFHSGPREASQAGSLPPWLASCTLAQLQLPPALIAAIQEYLQDQQRKQQQGQGSRQWVGPVRPGAPQQASAHAAPRRCRTLSDFRQASPGAVKAGGGGSMLDLATIAEGAESIEHGGRSRSSLQSGHSLNLSQAGQGSQDGASAQLLASARGSGGVPGVAESQYIMATGSVQEALLGAGAGIGSPRTSSHGGRLRRWVAEGCRRPIC